MNPLHVPQFTQLPISRALARDLRSDHAGEHGAVAIYVGILAVTRSDAVRSFARHHLRTEARHRRFFERWLPREYRSRLLPVWWAAGWLLGAIAALGGRRFVFRTIEAVETFVEGHYQAQIDAMRGEPRLSALRQILEKFCADEVAHRDDAARRNDRLDGLLDRLWVAIVGGGSAAGVALARLI